MARKSRDEHLIQVLHVAEMYYFEHMTQSAIAERLSLSRWTVGRMLESARDSGLVHITIDHPLARHHRLEVELTERFGLAKAIVVPTQARPDTTLDLIASAAADSLTLLRPAPSVIGVSWGRTMAQVVHHLRPGWNHDVTVVQTNGGVAITRNDLVGRSVVLMAERGRGRALTLQAPTVLGSVELCRMLRADASVARTLEMASHADLLVYAPGAADSGSVLVGAGHIPPADMERLRAAGAKADVMSHFVDSSGRPVDPDLDARTLSMDLDAIRRASRVIAVGAGLEKAEAIGATLSGGLCTEVVTDSEVAEAVLGRAAGRSGNRS
ncbi:MAG: TetR family transcriptional regulator [Acidipropionibacterium sp.]|jgi:deoxyribonucleoside regulator|nr:TetR family transcriptional regulator [Acidipropionibacterium sp.]